MARMSILERRQAVRIALYAAPATLLMLGVFVAPLGTVLLQSLSTEGTAGLSFHTYARIGSDQLFARVGWITLQITLLATGFALLLAYPLAYYLAQQSARRRGVLMVPVLVPLWTSILAKSFAFTGHSWPRRTDQHGD